ncbi:DUF2165 family protein [Chachezhania antarctica]|uniref:DUF2165 family protein n=1 Tax=Chachezhania antarctica TaxID=2340860 RepID=UPI000EAF8D97|nr:DUF2165 family protein [Chachezhania antarctica]
MPDPLILLAQCFAVSALAGWMLTGLWDNLAHPRINADLVDEVLTLARLKTDYPDAYARLKHREVRSPAFRRTVFGLAIALESAAVLGLACGSVLLFLAMLGIVPATLARSAALIGTVLFSSVWAGFVIAGNYFCYWCGHEGAQNTHFQLLLCGLGTMILLILP